MLIAKKSAIVRCLFTTLLLQLPPLTSSAMLCETLLWEQGTATATSPWKVPCILTEPEGASNCLQQCSGGFPSAGTVVWKLSYSQQIHWGSSDARVRGILLLRCWLPRDSEKWSECNPVLIISLFSLFFLVAVLTFSSFSSLGGLLLLLAVLTAHLELLSIIILLTHLSINMVLKPPFGCEKW